MRFTIPTDDLRAGMLKVIGAVQKNTPLEILRAVRISAGKGHITLTATNMDIGAEVSLDARVDADGATCVPAHDLLKFATLKKAKGDLEFASDGVTLRVQAGSASIGFREMEVSEFPEFRMAERIDMVEISPPLFGDALSWCRSAAAEDEASWTMRGVEISVADGKTVFTGTDRRRVHRRQRQ